MKKTLSALAMAAGLLLATVPASATIIVRFVPDVTHINVGGDANIDVRIEGLGAEILSGVDINILFAGGAAAWTLADFTGLNNALNLGNAGDSDLTFDTVSPGDVGIQAVSFLLDPALVAGQADSFLLGTFTMHGVIDGVTNIQFGPNLFFQRNFVGLDAASLDVLVLAACVEVGTGDCGGGRDVPEPASLGLVGLGLLAAVAVGRTRRRTRYMA